MSALVDCRTQAGPALDRRTEAKAISFNAPMVRAVMEGRKTMTRRPMKPQPARGCSFVMNGAGTHALHFEGDAWPARGLPTLVPPTGRSTDHRLASPYAPGDRLWVRETARVIELDVGLVYVDGDYLKASQARLMYESDGALSDWLPYPDRLKLLAVGQCIPNGCYREAARTYLDVTKVRAERLQDITEADAIAEGVELPGSIERERGGEFDFDPSVCWTCGGIGVHGMDYGQGWTEIDCRKCDTAVKRFRNLWTSIYGPDAWDRNDWVWVAEFKQVTTTKEATT